MRATFWRYHLSLVLLETVILFHSSGALASPACTAVFSGKSISRAALTPERAAEYEAAAAIFHYYLKSPDHPGKFNFLTKGAVQVVKSYEISDRIFDQLTDGLRATLSGNAATVERAELKGKMDLYESNRYMHALARRFLSAETQAQINLEGLDVSREGFTREVQTRLYEYHHNVRLEGKEIDPADKLRVRDAPPPKGSIDSTFTYYTKALVGKSGGKHQLRLRTYLRETNGIVTYAPHGQKFKLEIKSALKHRIIAERYGKLAGDHGVQKLDVILTREQAFALFASFKATNAAAKTVEALSRIDALKAELIAKAPKTRARVEAVFAVLETGIRISPDFLLIEGDTHYPRSPFESPVGFQSTIDRGQTAHRGDMYNADGTLKDPMTILRTLEPFESGIGDARHVELKLPLDVVAAVLGIRYYDSSASALQTPTANPGRGVDKSVDLMEYDPE